MHVSKTSCFSLLLAGVAGTAIVTGCKSLPPSKPESEFTPQEARGQVVYKVKCARCHNATNTKPRKGPGLQALTKVKAMPSGAPPNDERMTDRILHGYGMMPTTQLTDEQLQDLLVYLHTI